MPIFGRGKVIDLDELEKYPVTCSRCKKKFKNRFLPKKGGVVYCRKCTHIIFAISDIERECMKQVWSSRVLEMEELARGINALLEKEKYGIVREDELAVSELLKRLMKDEKGVLSIVKHLRRLQRKKK